MRTLNLFLGRNCFCLIALSGLLICTSYDAYAASALLGSTTVQSNGYATLSVEAPSDFWNLFDEADDGYIYLTAETDKGEIRRYLDVKSTQSGAKYGSVFVYTMANGSSGIITPNSLRNAQIQLWKGESRLSLFQNKSLFASDIEEQRYKLMTSLASAYLPAEVASEVEVLSNLLRGLLVGAEGKPSKWPTERVAALKEDISKQLYEDNSAANQPVQYTKTLLDQVVVNLNLINAGKLSVITLTLQDLLDLSEEIRPSFTTCITGNQYSHPMLRDVSLFPLGRDPILGVSLSAIIARYLPEANIAELSSYNDYTAEYKTAFESLYLMLPRQNRLPEAFIFGPGAKASSSGFHLSQSSEAIFGTSEITLFKF